MTTTGDLERRPTGRADRVRRMAGNHRRLERRLATRDDARPRRDRRYRFARHAAARGGWVRPPRIDDPRAVLSRFARVARSRAFDPWRARTWAHADAVTTLEAASLDQLDELEPATTGPTVDQLDTGPPQPGALLDVEQLTAAPHGPTAAGVMPAAA